MVACPLAACAGAMESESRGVEREAGLGLVEAMDDEAGGRRRRRRGGGEGGGEGRRAMDGREFMAFIEAERRQKR